MKWLLAVILTLTAQLSMANEVQLINITNSVPGSDHYRTLLKLRLNEQDEILALIKETYTEPELTLTNRKYYEFTELPTGVTIEKATHPINGKDLKIVQIISQEVNPVSGGQLTIRFLYDAVLGNFKKKTVDLVFQGDQWSLMEVGGGVIENLHVVPNKGLFGVVGVKDIVPNK